MTVEKRRDQFPIGMRVLAVDDDPICLRLLETLLRKCQYHVTTTSQAITALKMLRENRNQFDLVISDVHMPDMDGFKLLELVGLEMDLPVIMLSANGDTKLVMKGITHGACDYLLKPIRLEELKNIWQHVVRKKKIEPKEKSNSKDSEGNGISGENFNQDVKLCKKRKDQDLDDDEEQDENDSENDDPSSQKKPRVVWSVELHRKFVAAVNQLGLEKAVPKKILDLMNVEKLSRENVASHLQKYRLYLKRISSVANQQANMYAALGGSDYLRMNAVNYHNFNISAHFQNGSYRPISLATGLGLHGLSSSATGLGLHGLSSSGTVHTGQSQIIRGSSIANGSKFHAGMFPVDHTGVLQGMPTSLEFDHIGLTSVSSGNVTDREASSNNHIENNMSLQDSRFQDSRFQDSRLNALSEAGLMNENLGQNMSYKSDFLNHGNFSNNSSMSVQGAYQTGLGGFGSIVQPRYDPGPNQHGQLGQNSGLDMAVKMKQGQFGDNHGGRPMGNYGVNGAGSLEDVVTAMYNRV